MNTAFAKNIKVILFILASVTILVVLYALVFRVNFGGSVVFKVQFDYVGTIMVGSPVRKSGVKVGSVSQIEINEQDQKTVYVYLGLYPGQVIREEDKVAIVSGGILGDQFVEIFPGRIKSKVLPTGSLIIGEANLDLRGLTTKGETILTDVATSTKIIADILEKNEKSVSNIIKNLETVSGNLAEISVLAQKEAPAILDQAKLAAEGVAKASVRAESILAKLDGQLAEAGPDIVLGLKNFRTMTNDLGKILQGLSKEDGLIGLLQSKDFTAKLQATLKSVQASSENLQKITEALKGAVAP